MRCVKIESRPVQLGEWFGGRRKEGGGGVNSQPKLRREGLATSKTVRGVSCERGRIGHTVPMLESNMGRGGGPRFGLGHGKLLRQLER